MISAVFQVLLGSLGVVGLLLKFIGPLTIATTISLIGLSLFEVGAQFSGVHWWIAIMSVDLLIHLLCRTLIVHLSNYTNIYNNFSYNLTC